MIALLRRNRDYRLLIIATIISLGGDWFATVALSGLVLDKTNNDFLAAMVFVAASLPAFFMTPLAGPVADRFDRKRIMVVCSALQAGVACLLLLSGRWWGMGIIAQAGIAAISAFFGPASQATLPNLVEPSDLATVTAASGAIWGAMLIIGSSLGAIVSDRFGRQTAFAIDAASFGVAGLLIVLIRGKTRADTTARTSNRIRPITDTKEALRYARSNEYVSAFLLSKFGFGLGTGVVGLLAVLAKRRFGSGDGGTGLLLAARGTGVFVGPWLIRYASRRGLSAVILACGVGAITYGLGYLVVSKVTVIGLAAIVILCAHLGGGVQWSGAYFGLQTSAPDEFRGRIMAADFALVTLSMSASLAAAGLASRRYGPGPVIAVLGVVQVLWGSFFLIRTRRLRASDSYVEPDVVGGLDTRVGASHSTRR